MSRRLSICIVVPLWIVAVVLCVVIPVAQANAEGWHRVHLKATPKSQTWQSAPVSTNRELSFAIIVNGHDISRRGGAVSACRYLLIQPKLSVEVRTDCRRNKAPTIVRYSGSRRFTFLWALGGY